MEDWEKRKKHREDFNTACNKAGCKFFPDSILARLWKGKEFWEAFHELGHSHTNDEDCICRTKQ